MTSFIETKIIEKEDRGVGKFVEDIVEDVLWDYSTKEIILLCILFIFIICLFSNWVSRFRTSRLKSVTDDKNGKKME